MLTVLKRIFRRAPLLVLILLIWLVLTVLALIGRGRAYREYSTQHGRVPALSLVMRGIHDRIYPWSEAPGRAAADADGKEPKGAAEDGTGTADAAGTDKQDTADAQKTADSAQIQDGLLQTPSESPKSPAQPAEPVSLTVPESSCSKVVGAKDYGVADKTYLSPDDTVYNTDKEGLFAPDGTYYSLQEVDDSYFADALMIGDSRTVGLYEYGDMADVTSFLARESSTIYDLFNDDEKMEYTPRGKKSTERTLKDLLKKAKFSKIYISVGVNELGVPDTKDYYNEFREVIKKINKLQPDAIIYIQGIMHVSKKMSSSDPVYNNKAIVQRNKAISTLANGRSIFYIDMNADLCDENGDLKQDLTGDGIHLKASACELWHKFLRKNAIVIPAAAGAEPAGQSPAGQTPAGQTPSAEAPAEEVTAGQTPSAEAPAAEAPAGQVPAGRQTE